MTKTRGAFRKYPSQLIFASFLALSLMGVSARGSTVEIKEIKIGEGAPVKYLGKVVVHLEVWINDTKLVFSTRLALRPIIFPVGLGLVIAGLDKGVTGMRQGGKRRLVIPSQLAYGERGVATVIPPNATITMEVEVLHVI